MLPEAFAQDPDPDWSALLQTYYLAPPARALAGFTWFEDLTQRVRVK